jgi:hypothetical protein
LKLETGNLLLDDKMIVKNTIILCALAIVCGCSSVPSKHTDRDASQVIQIEVVKSEEHLGHNSNESGGHSVWCDGCRVRLAPSGDPFIIYWINNQIKDTTFRFKQGQKYTVWFTGDVGTGVMAYQGRCIDLRQVVKLEER